MPSSVHKGRGAVSTREGRFDMRPVELTEEEAERRAERAPETILSAMQAGKKFGMQTLNDALASQQQEILLLRRQLELLKELQDQQGRALDQLPDLPAADEKPPHY